MRAQGTDRRSFLGEGRIRAFVLLSFLALAAAPLARAAEISIVQPADQETIHSNLGDVTVKVQSSGGDPGGSVRLLVDGTALPKPTSGGVIQLHGIDRGAHTLKAELLDANGKVLAASQPVTFYLWHASRLFRHPAK
ncbi:MAG: hypothetical protein M0015_07755 [Betaproteobacteria bacterium]|nr:hypothetical protein [Betaproteobacteria bacterium]